MTAHLARSLPIEELLSRSICPVKKEFITDVGARQYVDQVQGIDQVKESTRTEAPGKGRRRKQVPLVAVMAASAIDESTVSKILPKYAGENLGICA